MLSEKSDRIRMSGQATIQAHVVHASAILALPNNWRMNSCSCHKALRERMLNGEHPSKRRHRNVTGKDEGSFGRSLQTSLGMAVNSLWLKCRMIRALCLHRRSAGPLQWHVKRSSVHALSHVSQRIAQIGRPRQHQRNGVIQHGRQRYANS